MLASRTMSELEPDITGFALLLNAKKAIGQVKPGGLTCWGDGADLPLTAGRPSSS